MNYEDLISHFETPSKAARAIDVDRRLVDAWKDRRIPSKHQMKAEHLSEGMLKADDQAHSEARELASYLPKEARVA